MSTLLLWLSTFTIGVLAFPLLRPDIADALLERFNRWCEKHINAWLDEQDPKDAQRWAAERDYPYPGRNRTNP